jgi:4a-hydroxytetrahydrobiopterin dehydratase
LPDAEPMTLAELCAMTCAPLKGTEHALTVSRINEWLPALPGWQLGPDNADLRKDFTFRDFAGALTFVNAVGGLAERENHHPDIELGWGRCRVSFSTHDVGGISRNDFICAAKTQALSNS